MIKYKCSICSNEFENKQKNKNSGKCAKCSRKEYNNRQIEKAKKKYKRHCPECDDVISYPSVTVYEKAVKNKSICRSCSSTKKAQKINLEIEQGLRKNGFFGKKHSSKTIKHLKNKDTSYTQTKEFRKKQSIAHTGEKNNMYGKTFYQIWTEKYGKDIADKKMEELKKKQSINNSGKKNSMYGKPSPKGSGNGWSGWYKNWFFRSLIELSYMINVIEHKKLKWESGENKKYKITYVDYAGHQRNYFPDFIIDSKYMIECKPLKLHSSPKTLAKKEAAEKFCRKNGLKYKLVDIKKIDIGTITYMWKNKEIIFLEKYDKKFVERYYKDTN